MATSILTHDRTAYRAALADITAKAKEKLPECNGRVEAAAALVLAGDVALVNDHTATVASQHDPAKVYQVDHGVCTCQDYPRAPHGFCKHRLAAALARRVRELAPGAPEASSPPPALPEAPASVNVHLQIHGRQAQLTLRDSDESRLLARLEAVLARFPLSPVQTPETQAGWCTIHNTQMRQTQKNGRSWWSHRTAEGHWCKGK